MLIAWSQLLSGCLPGPLFVVTRDISHLRERWGGYRYLGLYTLNIDVFWSVDEEAIAPSKSVLVPPREATQGKCDLLYSAPFSISEYYEEIDKWPDVQGIVAAGTRIQCIKLINYIPVEIVDWSGIIYMHARILDGPYSGKEVEISDLSIRRLDPISNQYSLRPNLKILSAAVGMGR